MPIHVILQEFGGPDVLEIVDVPRPAPGPGEVLVRVRAASLNPVDGKVRRGTSVRPTLPSTVGWDFAGTVEELGDGAEGFLVGDRVYGMTPVMRPTGYGEFVVAPADEWAPAPPSLDDVHAAAVPLAALTALVACRDAADIQPGQRVLVHAAGGGVGHYAVQIAKILGAHVIATASAEKADFVAGLGADEVIDYRSSDFGEVLADAPVDVVLDLIGGDYGARSVAITRPGGVVVGVPDGMSDYFEPQAEAAGVRAAYARVSPDGVALREVTEWIETGRLAPTVSATFDISDVHAAHRALDTGRTLGKIVLTIP